MIGLILSIFCFYILWLIVSGIAKHEAKKAYKFKNHFR